MGGDTRGRARGRTLAPRAPLYLLKNGAPASHVDAIRANYRTDRMTRFPNGPWGISGGAKLSALARSQRSCQTASSWISLPDIPEFVVFLPEHDVVRHEVARIAQASGACDLPQRTHRIAMEAGHTIAFIPEVDRALAYRILGRA